MAEDRAAKELEKAGTTMTQLARTTTEGCAAIDKNRERASRLAFRPSLESHNHQTPPPPAQPKGNGGEQVDDDEKKLARSTTLGCNQPSNVRSSMGDASETTIKNRERASTLAFRPSLENTHQLDMGEAWEQTSEVFDDTGVLQKPAPLSPPPPGDEESCMEESEDRRNVSAAIQSSVVSRPGAYSGAPGRGFERSSTLRFSVIGLQKLLTSQRFSSYQRGRTSGEKSFVLQEERKEISTGNLAVANPILDDESLKQQAVPLDNPQQQQQQSTTTRETEQEEVSSLLLKLCICVSLFFVVLVSVGMGLGWHLGSQNGSSNDDASRTSSLEENNNNTATVAPSSQQQGLLDGLLRSLPNATLQSLGRFGTPQWKALDWLENHPELDQMEEWRKQQLFALGTFFYAMEGPHWKQDIRSEWMQYTENECFWFSTGFGKFDHATGLYQEVNNTYNMTPCNQQNKFQLLDLAGLELGGEDGWQPYLPQELELLTMLSVLSLEENEIQTPLNDFLPSQSFYQMSNLDRLSLAKNHLVGPIPSELGQMSNLTLLLQLHSNSLTGQLPTQLGLLSSTREIYLHTNHLTGSMPKQLGQLSTNLVTLELWGNLLDGSIPTQFGSMAAIENIAIDYNELTGTVPTELGSLTNLAGLWLSANSLSGTLPPGLVDLVVDGSLGALLLGNNFLTGTIAEDLCSLGLETDGLNGLSFDCSEQLCGCCWCPCPGTLHIIDDCPWSLPEPLDASQLDSTWPGVFPTPVNSSNVVTININTDEYPEETSWEWSQQLDSGLWDTLDSESLLGQNSLFSYTREVESNSLYRLRLSDRLGDGTCCAFGIGWFTITNSTPSLEFEQGTVVWNTTGDNLGRRIDVILRVDATGSADVLIQL